MCGLKNLMKKYERYSDEKLMTFLQASKPPAFEEIYRRYSRKILYYFYNMLGGDEQKAQDFVHDLFLKIIEKPELFDPGKKFSTWIFSIAGNMCKNEYRRLSVRKAYREQLPMTDHSQPESEEHSAIDRRLDLAEFKRCVMSELMKWDTGKRNIFVLRFQENLSVKEISQIVGCREGTVKSRLFYLTRKMATCLKDFNPETRRVDVHEEDQ